MAARTIYIDDEDAARTTHLVPPRSAAVPKPPEPNRGHKDDPGGVNRVPIPQW